MMLWTNVGPLTMTHTNMADDRYDDGRDKLPPANET